MKTKSVLLLFTGIAIGAIGSTLFRVEKGQYKRRKELSLKSKHNNKAFKETASRYKEKLGSV